MNNEYELIISIVNYNGEKYIEQCFDLLLKACLKSSPKILIVCIDNHSVDKSREIIDRYKEIEKIYLDQNIGYAAAHNKIMGKYDPKYFLLLNPDTIMNDELNLVKMLDYMDLHPEVAMATCSLYDENNSRLPAVAHEPTLTTGFAEQLKINIALKRFTVIRKMGEKLSRNFPTVLNNFNTSLYLSEQLVVNYIYGAYLFLRKSALDEIGIFDEHFFLFWEEIDLCIRARQRGLSVGYNPATFIVHKYEQSQKSVPEFSYYWHVASYFWIFKKYYPMRFILWSLGTGLIQPLFLVYEFFRFRRKWWKIHFYLILLSVSFGGNYNELMNRIKNQYPERWK